jgi:hypothetical protein
MTLSTPLKIVVLAAVALAIGMGGVVLLLGHRSSPAAAPPVPTTAAATHVFHTVVKPAPKPHRAPIVLAPGLPPLFRATLERKPVFVVAIFSSHVPGDRSMLAEARAGAHAAHVPFLAADVAHPAIANAVATWSNGVGDPAVIVVRRPGRAVFMVTGTTDRTTIAQAALTAR